MWQIYWERLVWERNSMATDKQPNAPNMLMLQIHKSFFPGRARKSVKLRKQSETPVRTVITD